MIDKNIAVTIGNSDYIWRRVKLSQYDTDWRFNFTVYEGNEVYNIPAGSVAVLNGKKKDGTVFTYSGSILNNIVTVVCGSQVSSASGDVECELRIATSTGIVSSANFIFDVEASPISGFVPSENDFSAMDQLVSQAVSASATIGNTAAVIDGINSEIGSLKSLVGSPLLAATVADMTDHSRIYVYTGSETGYVAGNWYYWDGAAWVSGGVYNAVAVNTDKTLLVSDAPADAKATGTRFGVFDGNFAIDLESASINSYIIQNTGAWGSSSTSLASGGVVEIPDGTKKITVSYINGGVVAILKNIDSRGTNGAPAAFSDAYPSRSEYTGQGQASFWINPEDHYLYFSVTTTAGVNIAIASAVCSADVVYHEDLLLAKQETENEFNAFLPVLYEGHFDWRLKKSFTAAGYESSAKGFATTDPIPVVPGNRLINRSNAIDADGFQTNLFIIEFNNDVFVSRYGAVAYGEVYVVPENVDSIRLMFGYASATDVTITKQLLSANFCVKMLTAAKQDAMEKPVYVAYGASTTSGSVHRFDGQTTGNSPFAFPDYLGRSLNLQSHNHGYGTTGFLARNHGASPNIMDAIFADSVLLKTASLVTITFGYGNDRSAGLPIGKYTDYYPYDEEGYHPSGDEGVATMLSKGATLFGCLNWCIKWISEKYPRATLVIICGAPSVNSDRTVTQIVNPDSTGSNGRPPYILAFDDPYDDTGIVDPDDAYNLPRYSRQGMAQIGIELPKLKKALGIPVINMLEEGSTMNIYNSYATDEDGTYSIFSTTGTEDIPSTWTWNSHPNDDGYKLYARYISGRVASIFKH